MFKRKLLKQSKFKRLLLKILNLYAYDKETLNIVNPNYKNYNKHLVKLNDKSFSYSRGYLNLTRKIKQLDIYYRYSPSNNLWNSSKNTQRVVQNINKETLISVCLLSLKNSIISFLRSNELKICVYLISDNSNQSFDNHLYEIIKASNINVKHIKSKIKGNRGSYSECCDQARNAEDLIFFIEDDYLFEENSIEEMIISYSRISSILNKDIIMCPSDYPFYYDSLYMTSLHVGMNYKWRNVGETLLTFMFSKKIYEKYEKQILLVGSQKNEPFEKPLHEIYTKVNCLAPVGSLSYHVSRFVPSINEDWKTLWEKTLKNYKHSKLSSNYSQ